VKYMHASMHKSSEHQDHEQDFLFMIE